MQTPLPEQFNLLSKLILIFGIPILVYVLAFRITRREELFRWLDIGPWMSTISFGYISLIVDAQPHQIPYFIAFLIGNVWVMYESGQIANYLRGKLKDAEAKNPKVGKKYAGAILLSAIIGCTPITTYAVSYYYFCFRPSRDIAIAKVKEELSQQGQCTQKSYNVSGAASRPTSKRVPTQGGER